MLRSLDLGDPVLTIPTIGFNVETLQYKHLTMPSWDVVAAKATPRVLFMGHCACLRLLPDTGFRHVTAASLFPPSPHAAPPPLDYRGTDALIYVVDACDRHRMDAARDELKAVLTEADMDDAKLLVLANKQDMPDAMAPSEVAERLGLAGLSTRRQWNIVGCQATTGDGVSDGLQWVVDQVEASRKQCNVQ